MKQYKECCRCNVHKLLTDFTVDSRTSSGRKGACKVCVNISYKADYKLNKDKINKRNAEWQASNRDYHNKYNSEWCKRNRGKIAAKAAKRRATKLQATPEWADLVSIKDFYIKCPDGYHVDHIVPLKGVNVRGLHILTNLQYLEASENIRKGNRHESDS